MGSTNRVSQACNPCRSKKRRCDGTRPVCGLCSRLNTECEYRNHDTHYSNNQRGYPTSPPKRDSGRVTSRKTTSTDTPPSPSPRNNPDRLSALKANSGAMSAYLVGQNLGSAQGRSCHSSPWNLGIRPIKESCDARPIYDVIPLSEFDKLVPIYFEKIHVLQGTFSEALFNRKKRARWNRGAESETDSGCLDLLFAMVGCISALFAGGSPYERALLECATLHLHQHLIMEGLTAYDVDGLLLRTLYLRLTTGPRGGWISSCIAMSALQDSLFRVRKGPHSTGIRGAIYELDHRDVPETPDILHEKRYRLAKNMNDWMANESGRPKAFSGTYPYRGVPVSEAAVGPGWEMLTLAEMSQRLDPDDYEMDADGLEKLMHDIITFTTSHDFVRITQINLAITIFRRLRSLDAKLSSDHMSSFVPLCCLGLDAAMRLVADRQPWHHCAGVPFQVLCTFLLLDTRESLSKVTQALAAIRRVYECFPTPTMQNTLQTATHLVDLARQRKEQDSADLNTTCAIPLGPSAPSVPYEPANVANGAAQSEGGVGVACVDGMELSPGLLEADFSSWDNIDWDQVLRNNAILGSF